MVQLLRISTTFSGDTLSIACSGIYSAFRSCEANTHTPVSRAKINHEVSTVEKRTGHHGNFHLAHPAATGTLEELSAKMSGAATAIAANKRLVRMLHQMLQSVQDTTLVVGSPQIAVDIMHELATSVEFILKRIEIHLISLDLVDARVRNQLTAVRSLSTIVYVLSTNENSFSTSSLRRR